MWCVSQECLPAGNCRVSFKFLSAMTIKYLLPFAVRDSVPKISTSTNSFVLLTGNSCETLVCNNLSCFLVQAPLSFVRTRCSYQLLCRRHQPFPPSKTFFCMESHVLRCQRWPAASRIFEYYRRRVKSLCHTWTWTTLSAVATHKISSFISSVYPPFVCATLCANCLRNESEAR